MRSPDDRSPPRPGAGAAFGLPLTVAPIGKRSLPPVDPDLGSSGAVAWLDDATARRIAADPSAPPAQRAHAEDWLAERDLLGAGLRLRRGLVPADEPGHAELRRRRVTIALRRLESWEARELLSSVVDDPDEGVRLGLASDVARLGDGIVLDVLHRMARSNQPATVHRAVLVGLRSNLGRLPAERVASVLTALASGPIAREVPGGWVELARVHGEARETARVACEGMANDGARAGVVRDAARDALAALDDLTESPEPESKGFWAVMSGLFRAGK